MSVMNLRSAASPAREILLSSQAVNPAVSLLRGATGYWDVANWSSNSPQVLPNRGTGGSTLDAQFGSSTSTDTNDPSILAYSGTPYVYMPGVAGNYLSVPDAANLRITGDIEIVVRISSADWTPAAFQCALAKRTGGGARSYAFGVSSAGYAVLSFSIDGTTVIDAFSSVVAPFIDGASMWVKATRRSSDGRVQFFYAADASTEPSSWTQLGADVSSTSGAIFSGTAAVEVGSYGSGAAGLWTGNVYRAIVRNGIGGTTVLDVDTSVLTSGAAASFTATTGQTVTINRSSSGRKAVAVVRTVGLLGTDDYWTVPDNDLLDATAIDSLSVVLAFRQWTTPTSFGVVAAKRAGAATGWVVLNNGTSQKLYSDVRDGSANVQNTDGAATTPTAGAAQMNGFVLDRAAATIAPITTAGALGATASTSSVGSLANSDALRIGRYSGASTAYQDFEFLFAAVFRRALSAGEISLLSAYATSRMP